MKITEKLNTYRTTNKKLLDGCHDCLINVHCRDHVTRQKSKQRHWSLKLANFHNQSPLLTMHRAKVVLRAIKLSIFPVRIFRRPINMYLLVHNFWHGNTDTLVFFYY